MNRGFDSAIMWYPEPITANKIPAAIVMHGWMGSKEKMQWLGKELAAQGFAALVVSGKNYKDFIAKPQDWTKNYEVALDSLDGENEREDSPLHLRIDMEKVSLVGHSMGGGGAIYFADTSPMPLASIVTLAPFSLESEKPGAKVKAPTLVLTGSADTVAPPSMGKAFFEALPATLAKEYFELVKVNHNDFEKDGAKHDEIFARVLSWLTQHGR